MQTALQNIHSWLFSLPRIWKKSENPSDFVWLAHFRLLALYILLKSALLFLGGVVGLRIHSIAPSSFNFALLHWIVAFLSICAFILLLLLGLVLASKRRPRLTGLALLCIADMCVLLAIMGACLLGSTLLLLVVLAIISCTTPLFVERISRYAKSSEQSKYELLSLQQRLDTLLIRYYQELTRAIQSERSSLSSELHDRLMQELSAVLLQISMTLMRSSADGTLQLNAEETARLEASLRRVVAEARNIMQDLKTPQPIWNINTLVLVPMTIQSQTNQRQ
jgi:signal transduction histidine kinase